MNLQATFDNVCAQLTCPMCQTQAENPCDIDLQTKIAREPALRQLRPGDELVPLQKPETAGYLQLTESSGERLKVIETWSSPCCGANFLWALLIIERNILQSVETIQLTVANLEKSDFITSQILNLFPLDAISNVTSLDPERLRNEIAKVADVFEKERSSRI